jgi:hypothetical protein
MKKIIILFMVTAITLNSFGQTRYPKWILSYSVGMPMEKLNDYIEEVSPRGIALEVDLPIKPKWDVVLEAGWNHFYERVGDKVYTIETASISGVQYRYTNAVPMVAGLKYHIGGTESKSKLKPYAGIGIGTTYINRNTDFGMYRFSVNNWQFAVRPELGLKYEYGPGRGINFGVKYYMNSENDEMDGQSFIAFNIGILL